MKPPEGIAWLVEGSHGIVLLDSVTSKLREVAGETESSRALVRWDAAIEDALNMLLQGMLEQTTDELGVVHLFFA